MIPYGRQDISQDDIDAVVAVLQSDFLTQGPKVPEFERCITRYTGAAHARAVSNGTCALHIACAALGLAEGDWLWTSPVSFVASANCGLYCGASIDFVDIDPHTYNMCPDRLEEKLVVAEREGRLPKIVVPVHLCGQSCDMRAIGALGKKYGFRIVEDASHAIGGRYLGKPIGACEFSDIAVFSLHPVKIITSAEGGIVTTNSAELDQRLELLRGHGITREPDLMTGESEGGWYYEQIMLGFNYRMTDIQAALGISQMARLDAFVAMRHQVAARYDSDLKSLPLVLPAHGADTYSALHLYVVRLNEPRFNRAEVFQALRDRGVGVNVHYIPIHLQPYYQKLGFRRGDYPRSEAYYESAITLPLFSGLQARQQDEVVSALGAVLEVKQ